MACPRTRPSRSRRSSPKPERPSTSSRAAEYFKVDSACMGGLRAARLGSGLNNGLDIKLRRGIAGGLPVRGFFIPNLFNWRLTEAGFFCDNQVSIVRIVEAATRIKFNWRSTTRVDRGWRMCLRPCFAFVRLVLTELAAVCCRVNFEGFPRVTYPVLRGSTSPESGLVRPLQALSS